MVHKRKNEEEDGSTRQACAACKHQRRKCKTDCVMAPHFPAESGKDFDATQKIFGVSNVTKCLEKLDSEPNKKAASDSFKWEASAWMTDPVRGPLGVYEDLQKEYKELEIKYKELLTKVQGLVQQEDQLNNHNTPISMGFTSQQLHQFVQNNIDNVNIVSHPNRALMNIGRHGLGHGYSRLNMTNNNNNIDHQYLMMTSSRMDPPVFYNYEPLVHDDYGRQASGRLSINIPSNSMSQPPQAYGPMPCYNNSSSNLANGAGSSSILGLPSISINLGAAQPFHALPSLPPPT